MNRYVKFMSTEGKDNTQTQTFDFGKMPVCSNAGESITTDYITRAFKNFIGFSKEDLIPVKIIYNDKSTICYFKDGSKEVVHCSEGEKFVKEVGVMSCIMKKLFSTRNEFKRLVDSGYDQPKKG